MLLVLSSTEVDVLKKERKRIFNLVAQDKSLLEMTEEPDEIVFPIGNQIAISPT